ncbi:beta-ketoacyl-[acyl-carrier-protein] synthase family protein [candidate division KSB1 bacterium]
MKVFVTGIGLISPIGLNVNENQKNLRSGELGIGKTQFFESKYASSFQFGEVDLDNDTLKKQLDLENEKGLTRTCLFAFKAFREAIEDANLSLSELSSFDTAFISASTVGGMCLTDQLYHDANLMSETSDYLTSYGPSAHTLRIAKKYNIKGFTNTINTACSSSANAIMLGVRLIKSGYAKRAIVGGVDSLAKYTVNGFSALQILAENPCKPFDENRVGLTLGEGAAYLVLESEELLNHKNVYAQISGYGNANDAFHASTISEDATGVIDSIKLAIKSANIDRTQIDYINAHGTGTINNDFAELVGLTKVFDKIPPFNSTKSYIGHTLGAAGAIEAIYSIFSINKNELYPSLNFDTPISKFNLSPIKAYEQNVEINHVLSNSYGFSGNCTSLVISKA